MAVNIIPKLKKAELLGRGGAGFPTWQKWQMVKKTKSDKRYIVCNGSEGEMGAFKDKYILENYPVDVVDGIKIALETFKKSSAYIYLKSDYYEKFKNKLKKIIGDLPITIFEKAGNYICGEETTLLNVIEGKIKEPRIKPPFPTEAGLFGRPTLINNVETFYYVSKISSNSYNGTRFYSISGDVKKKAVYELPIKWTVEKILKETGNFPDTPDFFVQSGGGACGEILLPNELNRPVCGVGVIIVYDKQKTDLMELMKKWADFFIYGNCDKCTPCREGVYRIREMINENKIDKKILSDIFSVLSETSLCPLGRSVVNPFKGLADKLLVINEPIDNEEKNPTEQAGSN